MAATEKRLGELHTKVAEVLIKALDGETLPGYGEEGTEDYMEEKVLAPSAAIIAAATKFLKDNEITCAPSDTNALGDLEKKMERRRLNRAPNVLDFDQARQDADNYAKSQNG